MSRHSGGGKELCVLLALVFTISSKCSKVVSEESDSNLQTGVSLGNHFMCGRLHHHAEVGLCYLTWRSRTLTNVKRMEDTFSDHWSGS